MHRKKIYLPLEFIFLSLGSKVILVRAQIVFFFVIVLGTAAVWSFKIIIKNCWCVLNTYQLFCCLLTTCAADSSGQKGCFEMVFVLSRCLLHKHVACVLKRISVWYHTTRKPEKINRITDRIFLSVTITDGNNSVSKSIGIYRRPRSVGSVGIYRPFLRRGIQFVWKYATTWWRQTILPTEWPREFKLR
jgi:hypothetical protein